MPPFPADGEYAWGMVQNPCSRRGPSAGNRKGSHADYPAAKTRMAMGSVMPVKRLVRPPPTTTIISDTDGDGILDDADNCPTRL